MIDSFSTDRTAEIATAPRRPGRPGGIQEVRRAAPGRDRAHDAALDLQPRCRRALHARGEGRDPADRRRPRRPTPTSCPAGTSCSGRAIRHSGWFPDYRQPQLFRRGRMTYAAEDEVHEGWALDGRLGPNGAPIVQIPYRTLSEAIGEDEPLHDARGRASRSASAPDGLPEGLLAGRHGPSSRPTSSSSDSWTAGRGWLSPSCASRTRSTSTRSSSKTEFPRAARPR